MKKGERLDISVSVIATRDVDDEQADVLAFNAMAKARDLLLAPGLGFRRFTSGIAVGPVKRAHRRIHRRDREGIPGEVCTCRLDVDTLCARHPYRLRVHRLAAREFTHETLATSQGPCVQCGKPGVHRVYAPAPIAEWEGQSQADFCADCYASVPKPRSRGGGKAN